MNHDPAYSKHHADAAVCPQTSQEYYNGSPNPLPLRRRTRSYGKINLYSCMIFIPLICFSAILLALVFKKQVGFVSSASGDLPGGYYLVDFPAARLIFVSSWSNSVAPRLISVALGLYCFRSAKSLLTRSREGTTSGLPTPYQYALLLGLLTGSISQLGSFLKYRFKTGNKISSILKSATLYIVLLQSISILIFVLDSLLHFSTEAVPFAWRTPSQAVGSSFSQGLIGYCYNQSRDDFYAAPCSYRFAGTGNGFYDTSEVISTMNDVSAKHKLLNISAPADDGSTGQLVLLGPSPSSIPDSLEYTASTVGVMTSCQPISRLCNLNAAYGASTPFNCSAQFYGDIQVPRLNTTALYWSSAVTSNSHIYGADFLDSNLTQPYIIKTLNTTRNTSIADPDSLPNSWYLGVVVRTAFGTKSSALQQDPDIITPLHGGMAYVLGCGVSTYNVIYSFYNGSIESLSITKANGTIPWLFNDALVWPGASDYLSQSVDLALAATSAADLAHTWSRSYSKLAVSILASVHEGRPNLNESIVQTMIVTKIARAPLLALVAFNVLFALVGLWLGVGAFFADSPEVSAIHRGLSVEGLVAQAFERGGGMIVGAKMETCFAENIDGSAIKLGLREIVQDHFVLEKKLN